MAYKRTNPDPETLISARADSVKLFGYLSRCPLYVTVRIIGPAVPNSRRRSFWLGWDIEGARWTGLPDRRALPDSVLEWAAAALAECYPSVEDATGMSTAEVAQEKTELAARRAARKQSA